MTAAKPLLGGRRMTTGTEPLLRGRVIQVRAREYDFSFFNLPCATSILL